MKQYNVTTIDGVATVYAENIHAAWEQATAIFSDEFLKETMLFENHYVELIVDGLYGLCEEYLAPYG